MNYLTSNLSPTLLFFMFFFLPLFSANTETIEISVPSYGLRKAILIKPPSGKKKHPAIVFMHGGALRDKARPISTLNPRLSSFSKLGFIVLAPVRTTKKGCCNGDEVVKEGIAIANSASEYLLSMKNVKKEKVCLVGFSEGALISTWVMTQPNNFSSAVIMSPSNQCGMKRAGSKNYCGKHLIKSGKVQKIEKSIIVTLGSNERRAHVKTASRLSRKMKRETLILNGNHRSFLKPRKDVNLIIMEQCLK